MTDTKPRSQPESQDEADEARRRITAFWPEHLGHLSPEGNRLGSGAIVAKLGVVCNCGDVLGFPPEPQDPEDYLAGQTENVGDEADPVEAGWNDLMAERAAFDEFESPHSEHNAPHAVGDTVIVAGVEFTKHSESPFPEHNAQQALTEANTPPGPDGPPWGTSDGPGPVKVGADGGDPVRPEDDVLSCPVHGPHPGTVDCAACVYGQAGPEDDRNDIYALAPRGTLPARQMNSGVIPQDPLSARIVTIDPTKPYSPADVELQLLEVENKLERGMHFQRYWEERSAAGEMEWEIIYNKARAKMIGHGGSEKDRHALCMQEPGVELAYRERHLSGAMVRMARESMHTLRALQTGYQTLSRSVENSYRGRQPGA